MPSNIMDNVVLADPKTFVQRSEVADNCVRKLGIRIPALVDDVSDGVEAAYTGWPDRLYVIDAQGRIAYKSEPGPFGFKPEAMDNALQRVLTLHQTPGNKTDDPRP
jgi:type I thyroxine 5'-deiodinase